MNPSVSVIIPTHNRRELLVRAVAALLRQESPEPFEILVCCDRCTDGSQQALRETFGDHVRLFEAEGEGPTAACNTGVRAARGTLLVFLDDDMEPQPGFLAAHIHAQRSASNATAAVVGYSQPVLPSRPTALQKFLASDLASFFQELERPGHQGTPLDLTAANFSIRRDTLLQLGGFDESYRFLRHDFELAARLLEADGAIRYASGARALAHIDLDSDTLLARMPERARNDLRLANRYPWCQPHIPFYAPRPGRRWNRRLLWALAPLLAPFFGRLRKIAPQNRTLLNWACLTRYVSEVRRQLGAWLEFEAVVRKVAPAPHRAKRHSAIG